MTGYDDVNKQCYGAERTASTYVHSTLQMPEVMIYVKYRGEISESRLLDIGCGAGRTAVFLTKWAREYVAIDYSHEMVRQCLEFCGNIDCSFGDVRDMSRFEDGHFDFANFANNGMDSVSHEDRIIGLREVHRVLRDGGLFSFSTHNREYVGAVKEPDFHFTIDPFALAHRIVRYYRRTRNRRHDRQFERSEETYEIINDPSHNFGLVTYYITHRHLAAQLEDVGFELMETYDLKGNIVDIEKPCTDSSWLYCVARKRA